MSKHDDRLYLGNMLDAARSALIRATNITRERFDASEDAQIVIAHFIQRIGEAARRVSPDTCARIPLPWAEIIGMRHKLVHDYIAVDRDIVWQTATTQLPLLIEILERHLG